MARTSGSRANDSGKARWKLQTVGVSTARADQRFIELVVETDQLLELWLAVWVEDAHAVRVRTSSCP